MLFSFRQKLIVGVLIGLVIISSSVGLLLWEVNLLRTRGYGHIARLSVPPYFLASLTLNHIEDFCLKRYHKFYQETGSQLDYEWPDANAISANIPEVSLPEHQPYIRFGIHILKSVKTGQAFLYSPNYVVASSNLDRMSEKLNKNNKEQVLVAPIIICVMAIRETQGGVYQPYEDYPLPLKEVIGFEAWKTWYFIIGDNGAPLTYNLQSDIPPIPGCIAYIDLMEPELGKFYYPEGIVPVFEVIYPGVFIPEDQILHEERDY